ncbi:MAG: hypothetical protein P8X89_17245 [Reinekea sp.]
MTKEYIKVDLSHDEKEAILEYAGFFIFEEETKNDLKNKRKKWISFTKSQLTNVIGELSYYFNRSKSDSEFYFFDQLISHLEFYESSA